MAITDFIFDPTAMFVFGCLTVAPGMVGFPGVEISTMLLL
jgi:hypothetical protein